MQAQAHKTATQNATSFRIKLSFWKKKLFLKINCKIPNVQHIFQGSVISKVCLRCETSQNAKMCLLFRKTRQINCLLSNKKSLSPLFKCETLRVCLIFWKVAHPFFSPEIANLIASLFFAGNFNLSILSSPSLKIFFFNKTSLALQASFFYSSQRNNCPNFSLLVFLFFSQKV